MSTAELAFLADGLAVDEGLSLDGGYWVGIGEVGDEIRFVAAAILGVGSEEASPVGVWAYIGGNPPLLVVALNGEAEEFSHFIPARRAGAPVGMSSVGAQEVLECASNGRN
ncbi:MAG: hypothetical protein WD651_15520 [Acidimicrobiia bacterium]